MAPPAVCYSLYYVTGRSLLPPSPSPDNDPDYYLTHLEQALKGGVTVVQIREKDVDSRHFLEVATKSKQVCDRYSIPMLINDRLDIALSLSCGLHLGQRDLPATLARKLLGPDQLLGVSVNTEQELDQVVREGVADYVGIGPCYGTRTKKDLNPLMGTRGVRKILERLGESQIKAVVIGGITPYTIPNVLRQTPAPLPNSSYRALDGLAIVSSIASSSDPRAAAQQLRKLFDERPVYPLLSSRPECLQIGEGGKDELTRVLLEKAVGLLERLREGKKPLIHHITNQVVMNDCANLTLALSCSPIMSSSPEEAPSLSKFIGCLLLNLGTLTKAQIHAQEVAGIAANEGGKPVVFDPVGIGATEFRREMADGLLSAVHVTIIKGNAGEIASLSNSTEVLSRGVDSLGTGFLDPVTIVRDLARREKVVVAMSGKVDYLSDGEWVVAVENGHQWQGEITGSGCMASTAVAAFAALADESGPLVAAVAGLLAINISAELAASRPHVHGPNTFRSALIDEAFHLKGEDLRARARIRVC